MGTGEPRNVTLRPAEHDDVPAMASIMGAAFAVDRHTMVQDLGRSRGSLAEDMAGPISSWTARPRSSVLVAQDSDSGELLGWICWSRNYGPPDDPDAPSSDGVEEPQPAESQPEDPQPEDPQPEDPGTGSLAELQRITGDDLEQWQRDVMPAGSRCRFIVAIAVSPHAQSRGVGAALISWGTARADDDGVYCWVHSSDAGRSAFSRAGFVEMGHLTVDLDEFAPRPPLPTDGPTDEPTDEPTNEPADEPIDPLTRWGDYTFHHMRRPAPGEEGRAGDYA